MMPPLHRLFNPNPHAGRPAIMHAPRAGEIHRFGQNARGFTLIESIMVIVITGVIAAVVAVFLRSPVEAYIDSADRATLTDVADTSLRRMARDLRLALPNSIRVSPDGRYLELLLTKTGGRYLAEEDAVADTASFPPLRFDNANCATTASDCQFFVVGAPLASLTAEQRIVANDSIVVYNMGVEQEPANAYNCDGPCNRARVSTINGNIITLNNNPFANQVPAMRSPSMRFQVVSTPVTYFCDGAQTGGAGRLTRFWNYPIQRVQPTTLAALGTGGTLQQGILATGAVNCRFDYASLANVHSGLIGLTLTLQVPNSNSGTITLFRQVHVDNTP